MATEVVGEREGGTTSGVRRSMGVLGGAVAAGMILAIGLYAGWLVGRRGAAPAAHDGHEEGPPEAGHEEHGPRLSPQTLKNLGVEFAELKPTDFVRSREVAGTVEDRPDSRRPVYASIGGRVVRVLVRTGQVVRAGEPLAEVVRDPLPRPVLTLTDTVLKPLNEDFHRSISELRTAAHSLALAREELARIRRILGTTDGATAIPSKTEVDLSYEERRSERALETARVEAKRHGLTDEEVAAIEAGRAAPGDLPPARRILERNRLWSSEATEILGSLPADVRVQPYTTALLGELSGSRSLTPELVSLVRSRPALAAAFLDVAGLIQRGETPSGLAALADSGALSPTPVVVAPAGAPDWDVTAVSVRDGAHVETGATLVELSDDRTVVIRAAPTGSDVGLLEKALRDGAEVSAAPMSAGAGPELAGLRVHRLEESPEGGRLASATFLVPNTVLKEGPADGVPTTRTWALRAGMRYALRVPVETLAGRFVLPADAVVPRGPDSVLVLRDGAGFRMVPVHVEYADSRHAVVANEGVFPGDTVVVRGAYALTLALQAGSGGEDAGSHHHHH
jgi:multidrug efflux pump subunit AcrA (membrane-fusion protein)